MRNKKKPGILDSLFKGLSELTDSNNRQRKVINRQPTSTNKQGTGIKKCLYWNCNKTIRANHFLCSEHYEDLKDCLIDKCPECGRYKDVEYATCKDCFSTLKRKGGEKKPSSPVKIEHSKAWEKGDKGVEKFFVYILKDDKGGFYIGQTRDLRIRLGEHRDGKTKSTSGRNLKLQYFEELNSRNSATLREAELKNLRNSNERKMRGMIQDFQDRVREIQTN